VDPGRISGASGFSNLLCGRRSIAYSARQESCWPSPTVRPNGQNRNSVRLSDCSRGEPPSAGSCSNQRGIWICISAFWTPTHSVPCKVRIVMAFADDPTNAQHRNPVRSPASITWAVWKALFLREAVARLFAGRAAWAWILVEPVGRLVFQICFLDAT
jgi:hypothetical protein